MTSGFFEEAYGGTLFLDEIAEAPLTVQAKILRAVEERAIYRVGSTKRIPTDVRLIFATNKDLGQEVLAGRFRKDLYYRINIIRIVLPPLRERTEDIPLLVSHFTENICTEMGAQRKTVTEEALSYVLKRSWSGNVRELKNLVARVMALHSDLTIMAQDLARYAPETVERETDGGCSTFHTKKPRGPLRLGTSRSSSVRWTATCPSLPSAVVSTYRRCTEE